MVSKLSSVDQDRHNRIIEIIALIMKNGAQWYAFSRYNDDMVLSHGSPYVTQRADAYKSIAETHMILAYVRGDYVRNLVQTAEHQRKAQLDRAHIAVHVFAPNKTQEVTSVNRIWYRFVTYLRNALIGHGYSELRQCGSMGLSLCLVHDGLSFEITIEPRVPENDLADFRCNRLACMLDGELRMDPIIGSVTTMDSALDDISRNLLVDVSLAVSSREGAARRKRDQLISKMRLLGYTMRDMRIVPVNRHARRNR